MTRLIGSVVAGFLTLPVIAGAQARTFSLESTQGLRPTNAVAEPATHQGKKGLRVVPTGESDTDYLVVVENVELAHGIIEAEVAGAPGAGAAQGARGFVGIAFRVRDATTYDAFYLRPTNGRAEDQERRNHATQYISHPAWTWSRLRSETPGRYESYVDLEPGVWTKIRIEVRGARAALYVHDQPQPVLIVNDVKSGTEGKGGVALWVGPGTVGHFRNLTVTPSP